MAKAQTDITFSGSAESGSIAPGESYNFDTFGGNNWGPPGVGDGVEAWNGASGVTEFSVSFALPVSDAISSFDGCDCSEGDESWTEISSTSDSLLLGLSTPMAHGDDFFINLYSSGLTGSVPFTGEWIYPTPEPDAALLWLTGIGLVILSLRVFRRAEKSIDVARP